MELSKIFGSKRDEVTREWRKLYTEELYALHFLPNNIRVIKSRRVRWEGHVARMGRGEVPTGFWWGDRMEKKPLEDLRKDGRIK